MTEVTTVEVLGQQVALPVEVRTARSAAATFVVRRDPVLRLLDGTGVEPLVLPRDRTLCILACVQYVDNDLGPYDEVAITFATKGGAYIHQLPVNGEFTLAAGRGIWGFPKWMADIDLQITDHGASCRLEEGGELVLDLDIRRRLLPLPARQTEMTAYAHLDGVTRRTPFASTPTGVRGGPGGVHLRVGDSHPVARELRSLGLPKRALVSTTITNLAATFGPATTVER